MVIRLEAMSNNTGFLGEKGAVFVGSSPSSSSLLPLGLPRTPSAPASWRGCRGTPAAGIIRCRARAGGAHRDLSPLLVIVRPFMIAMGTCSHSMPILGTAATSTGFRNAALGGRSASGGGGGLPSASGSTPWIAERGLSSSVRP